MTVSTPNSNLGRHLFGAAALAFGLITLVWHDGTIVLYCAAAAQIAGGVASAFGRTSKTGAALLGVVYLSFAARCLPQIAAAPQIYNNWGNFFEQFSLVTGAAIVFARSSPAWAPKMLDRIACALLGICVVSFMLEQAIYIDNTAALVPKWFPPSQMFWAVATTVAFALAAVALLTNRLALLAARLLTAMIALFGLVVWIPLLLSGPPSHANWSETVETFAIAGVAWILADLLGAYRLRPPARAGVLPFPEG